jgi:hypothetical protein
MNRVIQRLCQRLKESNTGLSNYVCESFARAFAGVTHGAGNSFQQIKWGLTGAEQRQLFIVLPFCLKNLVEEEVQDIKNAMPKSPVCEDVTSLLDPSLEMIKVLSSFIEWYVDALASDNTDGHLKLLEVQAGCLLSSFRHVLPQRNVRIPVKPREAFEEETPEDDGENDTEEEEMSASEDSAVRAPLIQSNSWKIPKAHGMLHTSHTVKLFGPLAASSAEVIEKRHCTIKGIADRTNQRADWKLQILIHEHRHDETTFKLLDDHATSVDHDVQMRPIPVIITRQESEDNERAKANAAFADSVHSTESGRHRYSNMQEFSYQSLTETNFM